MIKSLLLLCFCYCWSIQVGAQNQDLADSLERVYKSGEYTSSEIELLRKIATNKSKPEEQLSYADLIIEKAKGDSLYSYLFDGHLNRGNALVTLGNYDQALKDYFIALDYNSKDKDERLKAIIFVAIAGAYSAIGNSNNAETYYNQGIEVLRKLNDSIPLGSALLNAGDEYFYSGKYDLALQYFEESGRIFEKKDYLIGKGYNLGNMGMVYAEQGKDEIAENYMNQAIEILEGLKDYYPIAVYLTYLSEIYASKENVDQAIFYSQRSLDLSQEYGLKDQISEANLSLSKLYERIGKSEAALQYYKDHISFRDSIRNLETIQEMADLRTDYEVSQKQIEVDLLNDRSRIQKMAMFGIGSALLLISLMAIGLLKRNAEIKKNHKIIEEEKDRSEKLLLNILPADTAEELKKYGKVKARKFENVTVLFTDFVNFTNHSQNLSPVEIVESVDFYFSKFDEIIERYGLEKIKTIGDAYMCVGGLPFQSAESAVNTAKAALEIAQFVKIAQADQNSTHSGFHIRLGMSTGPVVAGVVGTKKFVYDIWGDTVNIASRMESRSEPEKINISEYTYHHIKNHFDCAFRGELEVKNKGLMKMYFVNPN